MLQNLYKSGKMFCAYDVIILLFYHYIHKTLLGVRLGKIYIKFYFHSIKFSQKTCSPC